MVRLGLRVLALSSAVAAIVCNPSPPIWGAAIDDAGNIKLGVRAYTAARVGSEHTDDNSATSSTETFPSSPAGHLRQHRYFVEAEWDHNIVPLIKQGFGPLDLLNELPFKISQLKYHLTYRGEGEGIYDYGPREYRTADQWYNVDVVPFLPGTSVPLAPFGTDAAAVKNQTIGERRRRLRRIGVLRNRLFQAFGDLQVGNLFLRYGKQILSWGETDAFRLLDNINPLDSSFGGFLVSLDERRVPLHMLRANYFIGNVGPISEMFVEGYAAWDNDWSGFPGIPQGSPWQLPNLGAPNAALVTFVDRPATTFENTRGGGQLKFNAPLPAIGSATFGIAHYYTYFDNPIVTIQTNTLPLIPNVITSAAAGIPPDAFFSDGAAAHAIQEPGTVQVTGASSTFVIPAQYARKMFLGGEPVIRTEFAFFNNEPRFRQSEIDPFYFNMIDGRLSGKKRVGDSVNFVLGVDMNQFIRWLNPQNSFFFSTQFFYKHLNGATKRGPLRCTVAGPSCAMVGNEMLYVDATTSASQMPVAITEGEVLPVPEENSPLAQPQLVHHPTDQFLQTLLISTAYYSSQIIPSLTVFYDWVGAVVVIPSVTFSRDPFRFTVQYNYLDANRLKGSAGTSLLRDRDNVLFQVEYVL